MKRLNRLDKYLIKQFLGTFVFSIILIISVSVVFDINEKIDDFMKPEVSLRSIIFDYYFNFVPYYANLFSPLFVFISVIFFTSKLAEKSEIIAMLSAGVSFKRLMVPYMLSATVIAILAFLLNSFVIPPGNATRIDFQNKYIKNKKVQYAESVQLEVKKGVFAFFGSYSDAMRTGYQFSLEEFKGKQLVSRLTADRIQYDSLYNWRIFNYRIRHFGKYKETVESGSEMDTVIAVRPADFLVAEDDVETMTTTDLHTYISHQKQRGVGNVKLFEIELHKRYAAIFSAFILTIIGASLSSRKVKGGMGINIAIGLGLSFAYILFMTVAGTFAISGSLPPFMAAWLPNFVFTVIAVSLYKKAPR